MEKGWQPTVRSGEKGVSISLSSPTNTIDPKRTMYFCERYMAGSMMEVSYGKGSDTELLCIFRKLELSMKVQK